MNPNSYNVIPMIPEIFMAVMAGVILLTGVFAKHARKITFYLVECTLVAALILTLLTFVEFDFKQVVLIFHNSFILDPLAVILKSFILVFVFITFLYSRVYNDFRKIAANEFYVLGLLSTIGMMMLVSSHSLLTLFLSVELLSLPTYAMVAMRQKERRCIEAAMKYFIIGALATGMLLYGFSMIFGATQSLDIQDIAAHFSQHQLGTDYVAIFGLVFSVAGLAFKLGAAPFHMWVPDVYDGAPSSVTLFISTAPKIAGFGMMIRLLVGALPALHVQWQEMLIVLSLLSMGLGNFAAIVQTNMKRMLAYSSIAHAGYMLLGLICGTPRGYAASMFYSITYALMTLGAFGVVLLMNRAGVEVENIDDFRGLNNRHPWLAFIMLMVMFSLAGVPPLVGFIAKVGLLEALIRVHLVWLAVIAILLAIVGAYYYLRVVKVMYFERPLEIPEDDHVRVRTGSLVAISLNGIAVLLLGVLPGTLFTLCQFAFSVIQTNQ